MASASWRTWINTQQLQVGHDGAPTPTLLTLLPPPVTNTHTEDGCGIKQRKRSLFPVSPCQSPSTEPVPKRVVTKKWWSLEGQPYTRCTRGPDHGWLTEDCSWEDSGVGLGHWTSSASTFDWDPGHPAWSHLLPCTRGGEFLEGLRLLPVLL